MDPSPNEAQDNPSPVADDVLESASPPPGWQALQSRRRRLVLAAMAIPLLLVGLLPLLWTSPAGPESMRQAERSLKQHPATGSTEQASAAALALGETMANLRQNFFTGSPDAPAAEAFHCHVWLGPDARTAVVMVRIPELRYFDQLARQSLADMAWMSAVLTLQQQQLSIDRLTVATRGGFGYDQALIGRPGEGSVGTEVEERSHGNRPTRRLLADAFGEGG